MSTKQYFIKNQIVTEKNSLKTLSDVLLLRNSPKLYWKSSESLQRQKEIWKSIFSQFHVFVKIVNRIYAITIPAKPYHFK